MRQAPGSCERGDEHRTGLEGGSDYYGSCPPRPPDGPVYTPSRQYSTTRNLTAFATPCGRCPPPAKRLSPARMGTFSRFSYGVSGQDQFGLQRRLILSNHGAAEVVARDAVRWQRRCKAAGFKRAAQTRLTGGHGATGMPGDHLPAAVAPHPDIGDVKSALPGAPVKGGLPLQTGPHHRHVAIHMDH